MDAVSGNTMTAAVNATKPDAAAAEAADRDRKLRKACANFEAMFTYYLMKSMRRTVPSLSTVNRFPGKETYDMIMDQKVAEDLSSRGNGLGIQDVLYRQLSRKAGL